MKRIVSSVNLIKFAVLLFACTAIEITCCAQERNPVVFLHGHNSDRSIWENMERLMTNSNPAWNPDDLLRLDYYGDGRTIGTPIEEIAGYVAGKINKHYQDRGNRPVDIISHSLGGIVMRTILANMTQGETPEKLEKEQIRRWIAIASPHYGQGETLTFQAKQMFYGSRFLWDLAEAWTDPAKSLAGEQVLCIAGIANNGSHGDDGLVKYWSAALGNTPIRYVDRGHGFFFNRGRPYIYRCWGANEKPDTETEEDDDERDAVFQLVTTFLTEGSSGVPSQSNPSFVDNGGIRTLSTPHGALFLRVVDSTLEGISYDSLFGDIVKTTDPAQWVSGVFDPLERFHGSGSKTSGGSANDTGIELLLSGITPGNSRPDKGLLAATYTLSINKSKGINPDTGKPYPAFNKTGVVVEGGRTTVQLITPITSLDLVFCIDSTGSMDDDIDNVKAAATRIVDRANALFSDLRMAVVDYRDFPVSPYGDPGDYTFNARTPFTTSASTVVSAIQSIRVGGGADWDEAVYSALAECINGSQLGGWREDLVARAIIIMGDAPPHDPEPFTGYRKADIIAMAGIGGVVYTGPSVPIAPLPPPSASASAVYGEGDGSSATEEVLSGPIAIYSIVVGDDEDAAAVFANLANATGGAAFSAEGADDVVEKILEALGVIAEGDVKVVDVTADVATIFDSWTLDRASGALIASITLSNAFGKDGVPLEKAFWYAITETTNVRLATVSGYTNGFAYYDVTTQVETALPTIGNGDLKLDSGESVSFTVPVYSRDRSIPVGHVFSIWADPPPSAPLLFAPSEPRLSVARSSPGTMTLFWPAPRARYVVEEADHPASDQWRELSAIPIAVGQGYTLAVPIGSGAKFYRLKQK